MAVMRHHSTTHTQYMRLVHNHVQSQGQSMEWRKRASALRSVAQRDSARSCTGALVGAAAAVTMKHSTLETVNWTSPMHCLDCNGDVVSSCLARLRGVSTAAGGSRLPPQRRGAGATAISSRSTACQWKSKYACDAPHMTQHETTWRIVAEAHVLFTRWGCPDTCTTHVAASAPPDGTYSSTTNAPSTTQITIRFCP